MIEITSERLAKLKQDCINVADGYDADPDDVMALIAEVERLREQRKLEIATGSRSELLALMEGDVKRLHAEVERLRTNCYMRQQGCAPCGEDNE